MRWPTSCTRGDQNQFVGENIDEKILCILNLCDVSFISVGGLRPNPSGNSGWGDVSLSPTPERDASTHSNAGLTHLGPDRECAV